MPDHPITRSPDHPIPRWLHVLALMVARGLGEALTGCAGAGLTGGGRRHHLDAFEPLRRCAPEDDGGLPRLRSQRGHRPRFRGNCRRCGGQRDGGGIRPPTPCPVRPRDTRHVVRARSLRRGSGVARSRRSPLAGIHQCGGGGSRVRRAAPFEPGLA